MSYMTFSDGVHSKLYRCNPTMNTHEFHAVSQNKNKSGLIPDAFRVRVSKHAILTRCKYISDAKNDIPTKKYLQLLLFVRKRQLSLVLILNAVTQSINRVYRALKVNLGRFWLQLRIFLRNPKLFQVPPRGSPGPRHSAKKIVYPTISPTCILSFVHPMKRLFRYPTRKFAVPRIPQKKEIPLSRQKKYISPAIQV